METLQLRIRHIPITKEADTGVKPNKLLIALYDGSKQIQRKLWIDGKGSGIIVGFINKIKKIRYACTWTDYISKIIVSILNNNRNRHTTNILAKKIKNDGLPSANDNH